MDKKSNIYFDIKHTLPNEDIDIISIGIITEHGQTFYAELNDYYDANVDDDIIDNIESNLKFKNKIDENGNEIIENIECERCNISNVKRKDETNPDSDIISYSVELKCNTKVLKEQLLLWLGTIDFKDFWTDKPVYKWMLFSKIFEETLFYQDELLEEDILSSNVYDLNTFFKISGVTNINKEHYLKRKSVKKPTALTEAILIKACYNKLMKLNKLEERTIGD